MQMNHKLMKDMCSITSHQGYEKQNHNGILSLLFGMAKIKRQQVKSAGMAVENRQQFNTVGRNENWDSHHAEQDVGSSMNS